MSSPRMTTSWFKDESPEDPKVTSSSYEVSLLRRFDGAARTVHRWKPSHRDNELWVRNGDCLVHLYGRGTSGPGPSFRVPLATLLDARCLPLIEAFADGNAPRTNHELQRWQHEQPGSTIDLYIPGPPDANQNTLLLFHIMMRNFFAWTLRRSMVGEHLGGSLIGLLQCMNDFRSDVDENITELIDYMDEEGYLNVAECPTHAIAVMRLAEHFDLTQLYEQAFDQSVSMDRRLLSYPEYLLLSSSTRWSLRKAKNDLDAKLYRASDMLNDFLESETSEANLGIPAGAREHLERFREFLTNFYSARFGQYPPNTFDPVMFETMRGDFEALYNLLVDSTWTTEQDMPSIAAGGLCAVQLVQEFDTQNGFEHLRHPLPQLPYIAEPSALRRFSWVPGSDKLRSDQRTGVLASLIKASNWDEAAMQNDLVQSYRRFEESLVLNPQKMDKVDRVALLDARKVRWILLYGVYQVLRGVTRGPDGLGGFKPPHHLADSVESIPRRDGVDLTRSLPPEEGQEVLSPHFSVVWGDAGGDTGKIEIKPDIDYFAISQEDNSGSDPDAYNRPKSSSQATAPSRSMSFGRALNRTSTLRKSLRKLRPQTASSSRPLKISTSAKSLYQGIKVQGYGSGTNDISNSPLDKRPDLQHIWPHRSGSTASQENSSAESAPDSNDEGGLESPDTPITIPSPSLEAEEGLAPGEKRDVERSNSKRQKVVAMITPTLRRPLSNPQLSKRRPVSTIFRSVDYAAAWDDLIKDSRAQNQQRPQPHLDRPPEETSPLQHPIRSKTMPSSSAVEDAKPRPNSFFGITRSMSVRPAAVFTELRRKSANHEHHQHLDSLDLGENAAAELHTPTRISQDWAAMRDFLDDVDEEGGDRTRAKTGWEEYAELGGLTEL